MRNAAFVVLVALAALGLGFYAGLNVGESRVAERRMASAPRLGAESERRWFESTDGGASWAAVVEDERPWQGDHMTITGTSGRRLFASDQSGLYESRDDGKSWTRVGDAEDIRTHPWKLLDQPQSK